jgi:hypothetical protein
VFFFSFSLIYFLSPPFAWFALRVPVGFVAEAGFSLSYSAASADVSAAIKSGFFGPYESATDPASGRVGGLAPVMTPPAFLTRTRAPAPRDLFAQGVTVDRVGPV